MVSAEVFFLFSSSLPRSLRSDDRNSLRVFRVRFPFESSVLEEISKDVRVGVRHQDRSKDI